MMKAYTAHIRLVAGALFVLCFLSVFLTQDDYGPHWDAHTYYASASRFGSWIRSLWTQENVPPISDIQHYFRWNRDHPPLGKILMGMTNALFVKRLGEADSTGLAVLLSFSILVVLVFLICWRAFGVVPGVVGSLMMWFMPRVFCHAHLIGLDLMIAPFILVSVTSFGAMVHRRNGFWIPGLFLGLALLTKLQAGFIPVICGVWLVWESLQARQNGTPMAWRPWLNLFLCGVVGFVILIAGWHFLWTDVRSNLGTYWEFLSVRKDLDVYYFGNTLAGWTFPFVMTLITTPPAVIILSMLGLKWGFKREGHSNVRLWLCGIVVPLVVIAMPGVKRYDGIRLFMPFLPFLACLSAVGFKALLMEIERKVSSVKKQRVLAIGCLLFFPGSALYELVLYHPHQIVYYSPIIGGFPGAYLAGMDADYLGLCIDKALPVVHTFVPKGAWLFLGGVNTANQFSPVCSPDPGDAADLSLNNVYRIGSLPMTRDIMDSPWGMFTLINNRRGGLGEVGNALISQRKPVWQYEFRGVPLLMLYAYPPQSTSFPKSRDILEHLETTSVSWDVDTRELEIIWRLSTLAPSLGVWIDQVGADGEVLHGDGMERVYPLYPTEFWLPGDTVRVRYSIDLVPQTESFDVYVFEVETGEQKGVLSLDVSG